MRRDDDFIRALLFEAEESRQPFLVAPISLRPSTEDLKRHMHAKWLADAGLFLEVNEGVFRLTNQGHDYLASIRDEGIWRKTKESAASVGGVGLSIMKDIAVAYAKQELSIKLGINI